MAIVNQSHRTRSGGTWDYITRHDSRRVDLDTLKFFASPDRMGMEIARLGREIEELSGQATRVEALLSDLD